MPTRPVTILSHATITEVGPQDGFQFESKIIPTGLKVTIVSELT